MSIEQKIADLLEESKKLQEEQVEVVAEEVATEEELTIDESARAARDKANAAAVSKPGAMASREAQLAISPHIHKETGHKVGFDGNDMYDPKTSKTIKSGALSGKHSVSDLIDAVKAHHSVKEELTIDVSEDVAALINGEELSEEFKTKAATIFEAAVVTRVKQEIAKLDEQFDTKLAEQVESIKEGLVEKVDGYLNYVVEQWMTDNELALENGMKSEIMESFITGMKGLFEQHYIDVPEEKFDVLGEMQEEVSAVKSKLDEQLAANVELTKQVNEMKRVAAIAESAAGMVDTDAEKFSGLAEELAFEDADTFKTKLQTIKENYFGKKVSKTVDSVVTDEPVQLSEETISPRMAATLRALGKK